MAINYTWDVGTCETYPTKSSKSNVVHTVHWSLTATDDSNNDNNGDPQRSRVIGTQLLDTSDLSSFTNWSDLKPSDVQGWVESALTADKVKDIKADLDAQIAEKVTPTTVIKKIS